MSNVIPLPKRKPPPEPRHREDWWPTPGGFDDLWHATGDRSDER
jgi:hypothetical protein